MTTRRRHRQTEATVQKEISGTPYTLLLYEGHDPSTKEPYYNFRIARVAEDGRYLVTSQPWHIRAMVKAVLVAALGFSRVAKGVPPQLQDELILLANGLESALAVLWPELVQEGKNLIASFDEGL